MEKQGGFWAVLPWLLMAAPFATQLIDRFRGGATGDPIKQLQVPGFGTQRGPSVGAAGYARHFADDAARAATPAFTNVARRLHRYRAGL
jgi:hypothetical protein